MKIKSIDDMMGYSFEMAVDEMSGMGIASPELDPVTVADASIFKSFLGYYLIDFVFSLAKDGNVVAFKKSEIKNLRKVDVFTCSGKDVGNGVVGFLKPVIRGLSRCFPSSVVVVPEFVSDEDVDMYVKYKANSGEPFNKKLLIELENKLKVASHCKMDK